MKQILAAMKYLADKKPNEYKFEKDFKSRTFTLYEYVSYCGCQVEQACDCRSWKIIEQVKI